MSKEIIEVNDKYKIILDQNNKFEFYATRDNEFWRDLVGDNLILAMFQQLQTLQQENARLRKTLKEISENNYDRYGLYDDDLQEQIDRLQQIATEAL